MRLGCGSGSASCNVRTLHARAIGESGQLLVGVCGRDVGLSLIRLRNKLPECVVRGLRNAVSVSGSLGGPVVHLEGKVLKDKARVGFGSDEPLDSGLRGLAGGTLQIAELDNRNRSILRST